MLCYHINVSSYYYACVCPHTTTYYDACIGRRGFLEEKEGGEKALADQQLYVSSYYVCVCVLIRLHTTLCA